MPSQDRIRGPRRETREGAAGPNDARRGPERERDDPMALPAASRFGDGTAQEAPQPHGPPQAKDARQPRDARRTGEKRPLESYELLVTCRDEADQKRLFTRLGRQGYRCRVLTL